MMIVQDDDKETMTEIVYVYKRKIDDISQHISTALKMIVHEKDNIIYPI